MTNKQTSEIIPLTAIREFLKLESASGILLVVAGALAMVAANTMLAGWYESLLATPFKIQLGDLELGKPLVIWVNDLLMAIFFLLVGLEIKREVVMGELSDTAKVALPAFGAVGGMLVPAAIYAWLNWNDPVGIRGWAIPSATDIAFALGVLSLFGDQVRCGVVDQFAMRRGAAAAALVEQNDAVAYRIEKLPLRRRRAGTGPAMHEQHRDARRVARRFPVDAMRARCFQHAAGIRGDEWVERNKIGHDRRLE
jgi:hypothetical protein